MIIKESLTLSCMMITEKEIGLRVENLSRKLCVSVKEYLSRRVFRRYANSAIKSEDGIRFQNEDLLIPEGPRYFSLRFRVHGCILIIVKCDLSIV